MKTYLAVIMGVVIAGFALTLYAEDQSEAKAPVTQSAYVCPDCHTMAMMAGKCEKCGKDMVQSHVLGVKDGKAMMCGCEAGCKCNAAGVKDGKCGCGKDVQKASLKGMYMCACAGGKCCTSISDKPGKCSCGMEMKKVE